MTRIIRKREQRKPRKLTLSPTKISTYLACRLMYKYTYINRLGRFYYTPKSYHTFGATLHRAIDEFHKAGGAETQSAEELVERVHSVWASAGYSSEEEEQAHLESATEFLEQYHTGYAVEGAKTLFTEKQLKADMGEFNLIGRIDRLDEHSDGHIEIIDYKSGRLSVDEEDIRTDLAMSIYSFLTHKTYPDRRVTATIYCLRTGDKATVEHTDEELTELEEMIRAIAAEIAQIDEETIIEPAWLPYVCPGCDYLRLCARRAGWDVAKLIQETTEKESDT